MEDKLLEIAKFLNLDDVATDIEFIRNRSNQTNSELILPLVGEFSSGKTSLINALTDSKKLETSTKPTTSSIYEIHFGCKSSYAEVLNLEGLFEHIEDISSIKNENLSQSPLVKIFDTSTKIPATTILVDTPGLSSPDPKHKQALVNFLPMADAILLVSDINQQITGSLTDFIDTIKLSKRPIFLVLTKCDTKPKHELEQVKKYISDNSNLPVKQIVCVSVTSNDLQSLYNLIDQIQVDKDNILKQVNEQRLKNIRNRIIEHIDDLQKAAFSEKELNESIAQQEGNLRNINRKIKKLIEDTNESIKDKEGKIAQQFENIVFNKLDTLVASKSPNLDNEANSVINNITSLLLNDFKEDIKEILYSKANERRKTDNEFNFRCLEEIDLSGLAISSLSYGLNLNEIGHQYDGIITMGVKIAVYAGRAYVEGATLAGGAISGNKLISVANTVTDIINIVSNKNNINHIGSSKKTENTEVSAINKDLIESVVGFVTDETMGKPQRRKAIRDYVYGTLATDFKREMQGACWQLMSIISDTLHTEAEESIKQKRDSLIQLKTEYKEKKDAFDERIKQLRLYKNELLIL